MSLHWTKLCVCALIFFDNRKLSKSLNAVEKVKSQGIATSNAAHRIHAILVPYRCFFRVSKHSIFFVLHLNRRLRRILRDECVHLISGSVEQFHDNFFNGFDYCFNYGESFNFSSNFFLYICLMNKLSRTFIFFLL